MKTSREYAERFGYRLALCPQCGGEVLWADVDGPVMLHGQPEITFRPTLPGQAEKRLGFLEHEQRCPEGWPRT